MLASQCGRRRFQIDILEAIEGLTFQQKVLPCQAWLRGMFEKNCLFLSGDLKI